VRTAADNNPAVEGVTDVNGDEFSAVWVRRVGRVINGGNDPIGFDV
jgi:hypothetical protein